MAREPRVEKDREERIHAVIAAAGSGELGDRYNPVYCQEFSCCAILFFAQPMNYPG